MKKEYIVYKLSECAKQACRIDNELFTKYNVKRGLRNEELVMWWAMNVPTRD